MTALVHVIIFIASIAVIWYFAGSLVENVGRISRRYCKSGFFTAFFILGTVTSISEFSVAASALIEGVPSLSVGNLIGASVVILLFIIPLLAVAGKGIRLNGAVTRSTLALILAAVVLPVLLVLDGTVTPTEGGLSILLYAMVGFALYRKRVPIAACEIEDGTDAFAQMRATGADIARILIGGVAIFFAAHFLVEQAVYFAGALNVPNSAIGLIILSLGTNVPEIVIALRSLAVGRADIAFGDYLGSAAMNTFIFGALALITGTFAVEASEFILTAGLFVVGLVFFFWFANTRLTISRKEGALLLSLYVAFLVLQLWNMARLASG